MFVSNSQNGRHYAQIAEQMQNAVCVDLAVAYIQQSGVRALGQIVRRLCQKGNGVRVICSADMGITDPEAVEALKKSWRRGENLWS